MVRVCTGRVTHKLWYEKFPHVCSFLLVFSRLDSFLTVYGFSSRLSFLSNQLVTVHHDLYLRLIQTLCHLSRSIPLYKSFSPNYYLRNDYFNTSASDRREHHTACKSKIGRGWALRSYLNCWVWHGIWIHVDRWLARLVFKRFVNFCPVIIL